MPSDRGHASKHRQLRPEASHRPTPDRPCPVSSDVTLRGFRATRTPPRGARVVDKSTELRRSNMQFHTSDSVRVPLRIASVGRHSNVGTYGGQRLYSSRRQEGCVHVRRLEMRLRFTTAPDHERPAASVRHGDGLSQWLSPVTQRAPSSPHLPRARHSSPQAGLASALRKYAHRNTTSGSRETTG